MANQPLNAGDPAPTLTLPDQEGREVSLSSLWERAPLLLTLTRHLG